MEVTIYHDQGGSVRLQISFQKEKTNYIEKEKVR